MLSVLINTILPIFSIIFLGSLLRLKRIIDPSFARTANQIVFNVAIPAMLFNEVTQAPFRENFNLRAVLCSLTAMGIIVVLALVSSRLLSVPEKGRGTFLQSSFHGNIGYMSYAIAFYALGEDHFARMAILSSFIVVAQNLLAVWALTTYGPASQSARGKWVLVEQILRNPIILTVAIGIICSAMGLHIPRPLQRGLEILSGMAFPTALLLIGASLSFGTFHKMAGQVIGIGLLKLLCLPLLGYALMVATGVPAILLLPGIILLGSPPATITYVMAVELGGDPDLAATSISVHTLLSALSYSLMLSMFLP